MSDLKQDTIRVKQTFVARGFQVEVAVEVTSLMAEDKALRVLAKVWEQQEKIIEQQEKT